MIYTTGFKLQVFDDKIRKTVRSGFITTSTTIKMELNENQFEYSSKTKIINVDVQKDGEHLENE
jgi:hypothetical protein